MDSDFDIELSIAEQSYYPEQWEMLAEELRGAGYAVELSGPHAERGASDIAAYVATGVAVANRRGLDAFARTAARRLCGKLDEQKRRVAILDAEGNVLRIIKVRDNEAS